MSWDSAIAFCDRLDANPDFLSEVIALGSHGSGSDLVSSERVVAFGVSRGFSFSSRELCEAWAERHPRRPDGELSSAELEAVSGGAGRQPNVSFTMFLPNGTPVRPGDKGFHLAQAVSP